MTSVLCKTDANHIEGVKRKKQGCTPSAVSGKALCTSNSDGDIGQSIVAKKQMIDLAGEEQVDGSIDLRTPCHAAEQEISGQISPLGEMDIEQSTMQAEKPKTTRAWPLSFDDKNITSLSFEDFFTAI